jgi:hypothetical protein
MTQNTASLQWERPEAQERSPRVCQCCHGQGHAAEGAAWLEIWVLSATRSSTLPDVPSTAAADPCLKMQLGQKELQRSSLKLRSRITFQVDATFRAAVRRAGALKSAVLASGKPSVHQA